MFKNCCFLILLLLPSLAPASLLVSNLENDSITQDSWRWTTGGGRLALGFVTASQSLQLDSITMRLRGSNFVAPVNASIPVDIYSSQFNGGFDEPGALLGSLTELSVGALDEYTAIATSQILLNPNAMYWAVLTTGAFEDLWAYQGGDVIGPGDIVSPSLLFHYNDTEWNQLTSQNRTFAMAVRVTAVPLPAALPLFLSALVLLFGRRFLQGRRCTGNHG